MSDSGAWFALHSFVIPPVLCYHKVERRHELGVTRLSPRRFARQMESLARAGWRGIGLAEFAATACGARTPGDRELFITFDDAYRGLREHAFPVLRDVGFGAACFVITDYAGRLNRWDVAYGGRRFAHLAWRDMERWCARGICFESHTATHVRLPGLDDSRLVDELRRSRDAIDDALGYAPTCVAYPFGAVDRRVAAAAAQCGYSLGFAVGGQWQGDAMRVPRAAVHCWSPRLPAVGPLGALEKLASGVACRCSVGTTVWHRLTAGTDARSTPAVSRRRDAVGV